MATLYGLFKKKPKTILLYNGNKYASAFVGHLVITNETFENIVLLLHMIKFKDHK